MVDRLSTTNNDFYEFAHGQSRLFTKGGQISDLLSFVVAYDFRSIELIEIIGWHSTQFSSSNAWIKSAKRTIKITLSNPSALALKKQMSNLGQSDASFWARPAEGFQVLPPPFEEEPWPSRNPLIAINSFGL